MKKTLLLMALLGTMSATTRAEVVWTQGLDATKAENYTSSKHYDGTDEYMCYAASASNTIAWWQDQVEASGALIIPEDAPRGENVWEKIRLEWKNPYSGGQPNRVMQYYLSGYTAYSNNESWLRDKGLEFIETRGGYFKHLLGAHEEMDTTVYPENSMVKYVDVRGYNASLDPATQKKEYPDGFTSYQGASEYLVQLLEEGYGGVLKTTGEPHAMSFYAVETNEDGEIIKIWYHDNNYTSDSLKTAAVWAGPANKTNPENATMAAGVGYGGIISSFTLMRTRGMQFDTYTMTMKGEKDEEDLFSHYLNLVVDGADYRLKYDLRNALADNSPVDSQKEKTGDISLKSGTLRLVDSTEDKQQFDKGGSTEGILSFDNADSKEATRSLIVERTGKIASEIKIAAASGNTLEVTQGNTATFGKLTGTGDLDKTGTGTAEVTEEVSLAGAIRVHEGAFILGADVALTEKTQLTVLGGGSVQGKAGEDIVLSFTSGVHENNGTMTLATTVKNGAVLKGSGTFGDVAVQDGGRLIVGSSPGRQEYLGNLSVNMGEIVFGVSGWDTPADAENVGWGSGAYSNIVMHDGSLTLGDGSQIRFGVGDGALAALLASDRGTAFSMTIATGFGNKDYFTSALLQQLAQQTIFYVTDEAGANIANDAGLTAGDTLNTRITDLKYNLVDNTKLCVTGVYWAAEPVVPEPATATLSLLALVALASRRRKN